MVKTTPYTVNSAHGAYECACSKAKSGSEPRRVPNLEKLGKRENDSNATLPTSQN